MGTKLTLNNGQKIPLIGLGTFLGKGLENVIKVSIDLGYRLIDTAYIYQNEAQIGQALGEKLKEGNIKREDLFIVSKLWHDQHKPEKVIQAIKNSLSNLQLQFLDLYLIHWPFASKPTANPFEIHGRCPKIEDNISIEETWKAMEECVKLGLTKSIGLSNFNSVQVERILKVATIKPVVNEVECNPYFNQEKLIDFCKEREILIIAYSPFYGRFRFGAKDHGLNMFEESIIKELAEKYKKSVAQIILRFLVQIGTVPVPKSDNPVRIEENFNIFDFIISPEDVQRLKSLNKNLRCVNYDGVKKFKEYPFSIEF